MTLSEHMARSLFVAWRLLLGDGSAMKFLEVSPKGARRSFAALLFAAPAFFVIQWLQFRLPGYEWVGVAHCFILFGAYGLAWVIFAFAIFHAYSLIGPRGNFLLYIAVYNWARVYVLLIMLPAFALASTGVIEGAAKAFVFWLSLGIALAYKYYITRTALAASVFHGILFVLFDVALVMLMDALAFSAFGRPLNNPL